MIELVSQHVIKKHKDTLNQNGINYNRNLEALKREYFMRPTASLLQNVNDQKDNRNFSTVSVKKTRPNTMNLIFTNEDLYHEALFKRNKTDNLLLKENIDNIEECISCIKDPLWKKICTDLICVMGPASVLKIWKSQLGEICPQGKGIDIMCETEEIAKFVGQYDFVILGSLHQYLPFLSHLRVKSQ